MAAYTFGDTVRLRAAFADPAGPAVTPSSVTFTAKKPDGSTVTAAGVLLATGQYYADVTADVAGRWFWRVVGTGSPGAARERSFDVTESAVI